MTSADERRERSGGAAESADENALRHCERVAGLVLRGQYDDALALLTRHAALFDERVSHAIRGSFHDNLANLLRSLGRYEQAHEHLERATEVLRRLDDAWLLAQVDETQASLFLAEGKYGEAARAVARAVRTFEEGGRAGPLAEGLTTQGVVSARLGDAEGSAGILRLAVRVAEGAGALLNAGLSALALIEEHGARDDFPREELYELYLAADRLLKDTQHPETVARLRACARVVMRRLSDVRRGREEVSFYGAVQEFEGRLIEQALEESGGSVVKAAELLGLRHQTFISMLSQRHRELTTRRKQRRRRRPSAVRKGS